MKSLIGIFLVLLGSVPALAEDAATLAARAPAAYRRIQHRYTVFQPEQARMSPESATQLQSFLNLVSAAAVSRIECEGSIRGRRGAAALALYEDRLAEIKLEARPFLGGPLGGVTGKTLAALEDQAAYIREWAAAAPGTAFNGGDPRVGAASAKLHAAYDMLLKLYPKQPDSIQESFYDPYCGLDFL